MKTILKTISLSVLVFIVVNCKQNNKQSGTVEEDPVVTESVSMSKNAIRVTTRSMEFQSVDTISSGWNTFVYDNLSNETHFFLLDQYPEGKTIKNTITDVAPVFEDGMDLINMGKSEEGFGAFGNLPAWYFDIVFSGGSGLISPKHTAVSTLKLDPGYYVMECYVKMPNGKFHTLMGMAKPLIVTKEASGQEPPQATINIILSGEEGISWDQPITQGRHTFSVFVKDQKAHENFIWHDINIARLDSHADIEALEKWMDWSHPKGLITPAPNGVTFLGGVNDMPSGSTGYFTVDLEPGKYVFISEVPNSKEKGLLKTFEIKD